MPDLGFRAAFGALVDGFRRGFQNVGFSAISALASVSVNLLFRPLRSALQWRRGSAGRLPRLFVTNVHRCLWATTTDLRLAMVRLPTIFLLCRDSFDPALFHRPTLRFRGMKVSGISPTGQWRCSIPTTRRTSECGGPWGRRGESLPLGLAPLAEANVGRRSL